MTSHTAREGDSDPAGDGADTKPRGYPEGEPEPRRPGTIATGPWGVGTVLGLVIDGHRGRRGATAIPIVDIHNRVGKGLM